MKPWGYHYSFGTVQSSNNNEAFRLGLTHTIYELTAVRKRVVFVHRLPELGFDVRKCFNRFGAKFDSQCAIDFDVVLERLTPYKKNSKASC